MKALARAVIEAVGFLELCGDDVVDPDSAVSAIEGIGHHLSTIDDKERTALRLTLGELIEEERSRQDGRPPRKDMIAFYKSFMENFGLENE